MTTGRGWQIRISHTTGYRYDDEVVASYNEARLSPRSTGRQVALETRVEVSPAARLARYRDYWGTLVHAFDLHVPHRELVVRSTSVVETAGTSPRPGRISWQELDLVSDAWCELLIPSQFVPEDPEIAEWGAQVRARCTDPSRALEEVVGWIGDELVYERGSTTVSTTAPEAWRRRRGVCQDFAHVVLAVLRAMGVPARYVSGYLHPQPEAVLGEPVKGESHAWIEAWLGEWVAVDPTGSDPAVGVRHVVVARGRDYADVAPLKGIFTGASATAPTVSVEDAFAQRNCSVTAAHLTAVSLFEW